MPTEKLFFDEYSIFYETSSTGSHHNRLNNRYMGMIEHNKEIIKNSTILDLASHDGRWAFAALKNGAKKVIGIEARQDLIKKAESNLRSYGIPNEKFSFIQGDIFEEIKNLKNEKIDIVFCFGVYYHIMNHLLLLYEIQKLNPKFLIIDTNVEVSNQPVIYMKEESAVIEGDPVPNTPIYDNKIIMGRPSVPALNMMLKFTNFEFEYFDWKNAGISDWDHMETYRDQKRITVLAKNKEFEKKDKL